MHNKLYVITGLSVVRSSNYIYHCLTPIPEYKIEHVKHTIIDEGSFACILMYTWLFFEFCHTVKRRVDALARTLRRQYGTFQGT